MGTPGMLKLRLGDLGREVPLYRKRRRNRVAWPKRLGRVAGLRIKPAKGVETSDKLISRPRQLTGGT